MGISDLDELEDRGIFKDTLEQKTNEPFPKQKELSEKDFIHESQSNPTPFPFWLWLVLLTIFLLLIWRGMSWYDGFTQKEMESRPFLEVTNRELSDLLWQFPVYLRSNAKNKAGYLTGFQSDNPFLDVSQADEFAVAPPSLLFLYHTWRRLLDQEFISTPIPQDEFKEFIQQVPEWQPQYWKQAPERYKRFLEKIDTYQGQDLALLPELALPLPVRRAFQGWKNYFKDGELINTTPVTYGQLKQFLEAHPNYNRPLWRNIQTIENREVAGSHYLYSYSFDTYKEEDIIPKEEVPPFLRVALYNYHKEKVKGEGIKGKKEAINKD